MPAARPAFAVLCILLLVACSREQRDGEPRQPADEPEAAEHATGMRESEAGQAQGAAVAPNDVADAPNPRAPGSFGCDGGYKVSISDLVAVITLPDGRTVQIARDPDDAFRFRGEALGFEMKGAEGALSRDEVGTFRCTAD